MRIRNAVLSLVHPLYALLGSLILLTQGITAAVPLARLELHKGDHVCIIGNTLAVRMQHDGWLETMIDARFPKHELVFRNLAFSADEVATRLRSAGFGTPDEWLTKEKADVILAFFGFNESFAGAEGLEKFESDLANFIQNTLHHNYSGKGAPRLVLFSPIAQENLPDPNLLDPSANNANIVLYTRAMERVAKAYNIPFVDLFTSSLQAYQETDRPLTFNGIHFTEFGNRTMAPRLFQALFGETAPDLHSLTKLRAAVLEKNALWFSRYRTVDGYNVYGGRSYVKYESGPGGPKITNRATMQREMQMRDVMTENRDKRIWAVAQGGDLKVRDDNLPPPVRVKTNKPGPNPDGSYVFLSGEEAITKMKPARGCKVNLYAAEDQFPDLINPVQMAWDTRGRLWVSAWRNYPERTPQSKTGDKLLVFEDLNGDGKADKVTAFVENLNAPTGFQFYKDGVLVVQPPELWFLRDTNGDGHSDWRERILNGLDSADTHHTSNSLAHDPGGAIYLSDGVFHRTQVETAWGPVRNIDAEISRFEPRRFKFERYIPYGFANPHGKVFDYWGNDLITDATGNSNYYGPAFSGHLDFPLRHPGMKQFWKRPSRPSPGTGLLSSRHFPKEFQENFLNLNVITFQGIFRVKVTEDGSGLKGETLEPLISSEDPNFRPTAVSVGPDGAVYFLDWHNPIIGHLQHHLRDPSRDHKHGRIYRITYQGRPLLTPAKIVGESINHLLDLLKEPEANTRERAKMELGTRRPGDVIRAVQAWIRRLDKKDPNYEHHMLEALWVHQWQNVIDENLLKRMLRSPEPRARAQAVRVLGYWRDRLSRPLELLEPLATDPYPRVRLEVVRVCSFFEGTEAAKIALRTRQLPGDYYLDYTLGETLRQLDKQWREVLFEDPSFAKSNPNAVAFVLNRVSEADLLKLPRISSVLRAILTRPGILEPDRLAALAELATQDHSTPAKELVGVMAGLGDNAGRVARDLARLLTQQAPPDLKTQLLKLDALRQQSPYPVVRQSAAAAAMVAEDSLDRIWTQAIRSVPALSDTLRAIPMVLNGDLRARAYDRVRPLLTSLPESLAKKVGNGRATKGRYVRISLPRRGTLTLAEVEVISGGRNIASGGKARQSTVSNGGEASRAIDGNKSGSFGDQGQTHTRENSRRPWWELDLGKEVPIEAIAIWNRTDGALGQRLNGFTLTVLDRNRQVVFEKTGNPAPAPNARFEIGPNAQGQITRAAIHAIVSTGKKQEQTFTQLVGMVRDGQYRTEAANAILQLPRTAWRKSQAAIGARAILEWAKTVPDQERSSQDYLEVVNVGNELSSLLPPGERARIRKALRQLSVSVFVVKTVREQMRYDITRLVVEAGKPFQIIFSNNDFMSHNMVVVMPGAREAVGLKAQNLPFAPNNKANAFIPDDSRILAHTPLVEPGETVNLKMTAPRKPGEYQYVCTYPGHWLVMWGTLVVTDDVEAELAKAPPVIQTSSPSGQTFE